MSGPRLRTSSRLCRLRSPRAMDQMQMYQPRPKYGCFPGLTWEPRSGPRADQHQSLSRERPLRPVPSSPVRSVSARSPNSSCQTVIHELSQAFSCQQLAFRQEFVSELWHFSLLSSRAGALSLQNFSILLDEIPRITLWSHCNPTCLHLESRQELWGPRASCLALSSVTAGCARSASAVVGPSARTHGGT